MQSHVDASQARKIANAWLSYDMLNPCGDPGPGPVIHRALGEQVGRFSLANDVPLYEFGVFDEADHPCGSILVAGSKGYPAIVEYTTQGKGLYPFVSEALATILGRNEFASRGGLDDNPKLYYCGPFDIVAEVRLNNGKFLYVRVPNYSIDSSRSQLPLGLKPSRRAYKEWDFYLRDGPRASDRLGGDCLVLNFNAPSRYQQTCRAGAGNSDTAEPQYCGSGMCISGCTPVAWAALASSFRGYDEFMNMWVDNAHFGLEWDSSEHIKPADPVIDNIIWDCHTYMATGCSGNTSSNRLVDAGWLFRRYGYACTFGHVSVGTNFFRGVMKGGMTLMGHAQSRWNPSIDSRHSFVVWGYDTRGFSDMLLVCMGWGSSIADRWVSGAVLGGLEATYLSSINLMASKHIPAYVSEDVRRKRGFQT